MATQLDRALLFRSLHVPGDPLVLPNAWDVATARIVERAGAKAVATTSAGVAWSLGAADGDRLDRDAAIAAVARIVAAVDVPVTADLERGFAADPAGVADTVRAAIAAGAVGVNLEDALGPVADHVGRLRAARAAADATGIPLFVNARIDVHRLADASARVDEAIARGRAYVEAGADGVFVLGALDAASIRALAEAVPAPLNVAVDATTLPIADLATAGAARVSAGSSIAEAAYALAARAAEELLGAGTATTTAGGLGWSDLNELFG